MDEYKDLLDKFVVQSKYILGDKLTGIYLHGSAVMGCFHWEKSDIDLLVVIKNDISSDIKRNYMDMVVELNKQAPEICAGFGRTKRITLFYPRMKVENGA